MQRRKRRRSDRAGRPAMRSPGRPPATGRAEQQRFWKAIARGLSSEDAAVSCGVSPPVGGRWFREGGGMPPISCVAGLPSSKESPGPAERLRVRLGRQSCRIPCRHGASRGSALAVGEWARCRTVSSAVGVGPVPASISWMTIPDSVRSAPSTLACSSMKAVACASSPSAVVAARPCMKA